MRRLVEAAVGNPVAMNLAMIVTLVLGIGALLRLPQENFPDFSVDRISISVPYPGAAPEEIEDGICIKVEEAIDGIDGIRRVDSRAEEGVGVVVIQILPGEDMQRILDEVRTEVDRITTFPTDSEDPRVGEILLRQRVMELVLYGQSPERVLKELARDIRDDLLNLEGKPVSQVSVLGTREYEISIDLDASRLRAYGLTCDDVAGLLRASAFDLPAGAIKSAREEILVRVVGRRELGREFEDLVLLARPDGTQLKLRDIATVRDGFEEEPIEMMIGEARAVLMQLYKTQDQNAIAITKQVEAYLEARRATLPAGLTLEVWSNETRHIESRLALLAKNGWMGLILVFVSLWLFLELRLAFWVSWGIPVSFAGALVIFDISGQSLNLISAFGLIMALGIIVDDAIVVGENIFAHRARGKSAREAAIDGTAEVAIPVVASTLTTLAAFLPLFMVAGVMGKFIAVLPLAMLSCLVVSLFEAMLILPVHLRHAEAAPEVEASGLRKRVRGAVDGLFDGLLERIYAPLLRVSLNRRLVTIAIFIAVLLVSAGLFIGGFVGTNLFPKDENESYIARLRLPAGTPVQRTRERLAIIESAARDLNESFRERNGGQPVVEKVIAVAGQWSGLPPEHAAHFGEVQLELTRAETRLVRSLEILSAWRDAVGVIPEAISLTFTTKDLQPGGAPIEVLLLGEDFSDLRAAADDLKSTLARYEGVFDIEDDLRPGKRELRLSLTDAGRSAGLTLRDISLQVRGAFFGAEAMELQRGRDEVEVKVRLPLEERSQLAQLESLRLRLADGRELPLREVARVEMGRGFSKIRRLDRRRRVLVRADIDEARGNASEVMAEVIDEVLPALCKTHGVTYSLDGQAKESQESLASLGPGFVLALFLIYVVLAVLFRSYSQPLIIMTAIPFSMVGVLLGHWAFGMDFTLLSMFGAVALAGIVVNDALVLVDFINRAAAEGKSAREAVETAGLARFRAIMLTSLTTVAGLFPIVLETSQQAKYIIPMAVTISAGLAFATFINLILVPALTLTLADINAFSAWLWTGEWRPTRLAPALEESHT